jgi:hypothetical protein
MRCAVICSAILCTGLVRRPTVLVGRLARIDPLACGRSRAGSTSCAQPPPLVAMDSAVHAWQQQQQQQQAAGQAAAAAAAPAAATSAAAPVDQLTGPYAAQWAAYYASQRAQQQQQPPPPPPPVQPQQSSYQQVYSAYYPQAYAAAPAQHYVAAAAQPSYSAAYGQQQPYQPYSVPYSHPQNPAPSYQPAASQYAALQPSPPPQPPTAPPQHQMQYNATTGTWAHRTPAAAAVAAIPPLSKSFVAATTNEFAVTQPAAPAAAAPPAGRGAVHVDVTAASKHLAPTAPIQFSLGKKSRWNMAPPSQALAKQDTTEAKSVSQITAQQTAPASTTMSYAGAVSGAASTWPPQYPQQQQQQPAYSSYQQPQTYQQLPVPPAPSASASALPPSGATTMPDYVQRCLSDPLCPPSSKPQMQAYLEHEVKAWVSDLSAQARVHWPSEPLAYAKMRQAMSTGTAQLTAIELAQKKAREISAALAARPNVPLHQQQPQPMQWNNNKTKKGNSNHAMTGANGTPLGVRGQTRGNNNQEKKEDTTMDEDEDDDFIAFSSTPDKPATAKQSKAAKAAKKRQWEMENGLDESSPSNAKAKMSKKARVAFNAADAAKVASRADRFAEYNAEVAQSLETFKNPIQRHLFTAERGAGEDDLVLDWSSLHIVGISEKLEKKYLRLTQAPDPAIVRPERVLRLAMERLLKLWRTEPSNARGIEPKDRAFVRDYKYICEQFKAIRQDLTVQHLVHSPLTIEVYEHHARIALEVGDGSEYNQCQTQLKGLYTDNPELCGNQEEFIVYRILYNLITGNRSALTGMMREIQKSRAEEAKAHPDKPAEPLFTSTPIPSSAISHAFKVSLAALGGDFYTFFHLYPLLPYQAPEILRQYASGLKFSAACTLLRGFRPGKVEATFLARVLGKPEESEEEPEGVKIKTAIEFLQTVARGWVIADGIVDAKATDLEELEVEELNAEAAEKHGVTHAMV